MIAYQWQLRGERGETKERGGKRKEGEGWREQGTKEGKEEGRNEGRKATTQWRKGGRESRREEWRRKEGGKKGRAGELKDGWRGKQGRNERIWKFSRGDIVISTSIASSHPKIREKGKKKERNKGTTKSKQFQPHLNPSMWKLWPTVHRRLYCSLQTRGGPQRDYG